jgi:hypothetical protein
MIVSVRDRAGSLLAAAAHRLTTLARVKCHTHTHTHTHTHIPPYQPSTAVRVARVAQSTVFPSSRLYVYVFRL